MKSITQDPHEIADLYVKRAVADLVLERNRQVDSEGWTPEHDDGHDKGELAQAAICYLMNAIVWAQMLSAGLSKDILARKSASAGPPHLWPWSRDGWKPKGPRENLIRAGALILAEIERLDRAAGGEQGDPAQAPPRAEADQAGSAK